MLLPLAAATIVASLTFSGKSEGPSCRIEAYGIFRHAEPHAIRNAPGTASGREKVFDSETPALETDRIPVRLGLRFGVMHRFERIPAGGFVELAIHHPPLPARDGGTVTVSRLQLDTDSEGSHFTFDETHEMVPGSWIFEYRYRNTVLCQKQFHVGVE